jgi:hypothetical protein
MSRELIATGMMIVFFTVSPAVSAKDNPPGHDRVCLVTTAQPGNPSARVVATKWLPRKAAEKQAGNRGAFVGTHPAVQTQAGCESFLQKFPQ